MKVFGEVKLRVVNVRAATFTVFRSRSLNPKQRYYWKLVADNGHHLGGSKEGYRDENEAYETGKRVVSGYYWNETGSEATL